MYQQSVLRAVSGPQRRRASSSGGEAERRGVHAQVLRHHAVPAVPRKEAQQTDRRRPAQNRKAHA
eukprot:CAMPEP_0177758760 /NCGR_PEP_ID=MMETSP0491_2-20121128/4361_1 /TAXON_ID=63592 /ORGANISM="Tetraselmis chuii, Strain PLY429" /LENGTH=64 /DNA_ID=CAMNT_0019274525 /DNA_START=740 /DNA_END=931 /DNA_ORIENTATION=-